jgi:dolichyl-phosphate-mannose-protein mannosyltransferase
MGSSDFYESTAKYHSSSVAKAVVSPKVDEMEAGAVTTTMIVSYLPPYVRTKLTWQEEAPEPIRNAFEDADAPPEEKTIEVGPANEIPMLDTTALPPPPHANQVEASAEAVPAEDTRAPVGKDAGAPQVTAEAEVEGWHGDAEDDGKRAGVAVGEGGVENKVEAPVGAKVDEVVDMGLDSEQKKLADEAMKAVERE